MDEDEQNLQRALQASMQSEGDCHTFAVAFQVAA